MADNFYDEVLIDHNLHPLHRHELPTATCCQNGINSTCGDDVTLNLEIHDGIIENGSFTGCGCAVSQASVDIMLELIIGRKVDEAKRLVGLFRKMTEGTITDEELEELEEAAALKNTAKMPARIKCAMLGWRTLETMLDGGV